MIYFKPDFANGSIGSAKGASSVTMVGNGGCVIEEAAPQASGILNIEISPELTLTPTLESILPIVDYDENSQNIVNITAAETLTNGDTYTVTATPSSDYYIVVGDDNDMAISNAPGESASYTATVNPFNELHVFITAVADPDDEEEIPAAGRSLHIAHA